MHEFTKSQQQFFMMQDGVLKKIRKNKNYRKENVDELQNLHVKQMQKKIFTLRNKMNQEQKKVLQTINFGNDDNYA